MTHPPASPTPDAAALAESIENLRATALADVKGEDGTPLFRSEKWNQYVRYLTGNATEIIQALRSKPNSERPAPMAEPTEEDVRRKACDDMAQTMIEMHKEATPTALALSPERLANLRCGYEAWRDGYDVPEPSGKDFNAIIAAQDEKLAEAQAEIDNIKAVEFPKRVDRVAEYWKAKLTAAEAARDEARDVLAKYADRDNWLPSGSFALATKDGGYLTFGGGLAERALAAKPAGAGEREEKRND